MQRITLFLLILLALSCQNPTPTNNETVAEETTADPTLEQMIGQMLMVGFRGMTIDSVSQTIKTQIQSGRIGGIILFDYDVLRKEAVRNIASPDQVKQLIHDLKALTDQPLLMAVDQEGGRVNRLKPTYGFPVSVSSKYLGALDNLDSTRFYAQRNAENLKSLGFNLNFAPVVDVDLNPNNPVIGGYERSYSADPAIVTRHARAWISAHVKEGIISTLKHFPGHGSSDSDSHAGFVDITEYWQEKELEPFRQVLGDAQLTALMTAHVVNHKLDSIYPATLSKNVITGILRDQWQYDGVVFSDDLHMKAVNALFDFETILKKSIEAGVDILVYGNNLGYDEEIANKAITAITRMVEQGELPRERIEQSYRRIMQLKSKLQ